LRRRNFDWWRTRIGNIRKVFHLYRIDHALGFFRLYSFPWTPDRNEEFLPLTEREARSALARLRGYPILQGRRGAKPADLDALVDVLLRFSELCHDLRDDVREIDINPLIVAEAGGGACAVDCLIVPAP